MSKAKLMIGIALTSIITAGAAVLTTPATSSATGAARHCENKSCYGSKTCEAHGGTNCDLSTAGECKATSCNGAVELM